MKSKNLILVSFSDFTLTLTKNGEQFVFPISCAKNGLGEKSGSEKTPRGMHKICKKIGANAEIGAVFKSRKQTGETCDFNNDNLGENLILTRILWLDGLEKQNESTKNRYIYIHGTNCEDAVGKIHFSHGCVVMKNADILRLFNLVKAEDYVFIY